MTRRILDITIPGQVAGEKENRDAGKTYRLTEMPAEQAERWAIRAILAMINNGAAIPPEIAQAGMAGLASLGPQSLAMMDFQTADILAREMFQCVQMLPASNVPRPLVDDDIEEVGTRVKLRLELFALHTGFSLADLKSMLTSARQKLNSSNTETSPPSSE